MHSPAGVGLGGIVSALAGAKEVRDPSQLFLQSMLTTLFRSPLQTTPRLPS